MLEKEKLRSDLKISQAKEVEARALAELQKEKDKTEQLQRECDMIRAEYEEASQRPKGKVSVAYVLKFLQHQMWMREWKVLGFEILPIISMLWGIHSLIFKQF